jgi:protein SOK2
MYYPHISAGQPQQPQTVTSGAMSHYSHAQPPLLPPGHQYPPNGAPSYSQYGYQNGLTSPSAPSVPNSIPSSQSVLPLPGVNGQANMQPHYTLDTTGQHPPPGMKPRVTATLWEDEGSLCFQVEARGICVARREDNHMINGTKLLNVAGMTRGRRDGILKSEKVRHVVKIGPMHLKGVWIPYERALDFANKEKITELLYPLFVHNIGALLYHPTNQNRTSQVMAAAERRKQEQQSQSIRTSPGGLPSIAHPQSQPPLSLGGMPPHQPSLPSNNVPRPSLDRAHTFPTPPTSASGGMGSVGSSEAFNWQSQVNGSQGANGINPMDAASRSMPNTPATTPPTLSYPGSNASQSYESHRPMYNPPAASQHPSYSASNGTHDRIYSHGNTYHKSEMGPPSGRPAAPAAPGEHHDTKPPNGVLPSEHGYHGHAADEHADREHEGEYTHDSAAYDGERPSYQYTAPGVGALTSEANMNADMTGSPNHHPPTSGRATPRTAAPQQPFYPHSAGYGTPPGVAQHSSNVYSVMSNDRPPTNGGSGGDVYAGQGDMGNSMSNGYAPQPPMVNGSVGLKRGRDEDESLSRSGSDGPSIMDLKRRKTMESSVSAPAYDALSRPTSALTGGPQPR